MKYLLGFDIGGTKTEVGLFELDEDQASAIKPIISKRTPTDRENGYDSYLSSLIKLIHSVLKDSDKSISDIKGMGLGLPGSVHPETGIMINGNTQMMVGKDLEGDLRRELKFDGTITMNNDASCFALAEALCGAGLKYEADYQVPISRQQSIGIILGTGCGGGLIFGGKILNGAKGGGGEIGHTTLVTHGRACFCGRNGCAEQYLCGPAIEESMKLKTGKLVSSSDIFNQAEKGEKLALEVIIEYQNLLSDFLINLNNIYDPHYFVLGGGVSKQPLIYQGLQERLGEKMFVSGKVPNVYQHCLSDSAGLLGAAIMTLSS